MKPVPSLLSILLIVGTLAFIFYSIFDPSHIMSFPDPDLGAHEAFNPDDMGLE